MNLTRRETLTLGALAAIAAATGVPSLAFAKDGDLIDLLKLMAPMAVPDKVFGDPNAKATLIEYLSPTCPHCALVANTVIGPFKDKYVKTGKVKLILRPFARNTLDAGIFMLAEAASRSAQGSGNTSASDPSASSEAPAATPQPESYTGPAADAWETVIDSFFKTQNVWEVSDKPLDAIKAVAFQLGFSEDSFNAALKDTDLFNKISSMADQGVKDFGIEGTPTFYLNGKEIDGEQTLDQLSARVDPLL